MMQEQFQKTFFYTSEFLQYFNPYNYPKWEGRDHRCGEIELMDVEAAINRCVGYETVPVRLTHRTRFHEEPAKAPDALGVKKKGDLMFRALITWSYEENSLGVETRRYWVISPFISKQRCNSNNPYPSDLTDRNAFRTNSVKKVLQEVLSYPAITFEDIIGIKYDKLKNVGETIISTDENSLSREVIGFMRSLHTEAEDNGAALADWLAHALTGRMEMYIPASEELVERAKKFLEETTPLYEQIAESKALIPVFVSQFGDDDVARCYTIKPSVGWGTISYWMPHGSVDKLTVYETASAIPSVIKSKLAAMQINEANMVDKTRFDCYKFLPDVGAFMSNNLFSTGGKHGMVFLNPTEFAEAFPSE